MFGSVSGNILGMSYFLAFQVMGILFAYRFLRTSSRSYRVLMGSVAGSFTMSWFPILFAVFCGFTKLAHILALALAFVLCLIYYVVTAKGDRPAIKKVSVRQILKENPILFVAVPLLIFMVILVFTHTLTDPDADGSMHVAQSMYGDSSMHFGFITSIAKQQKFPVEYSLLPGTQLSYPFLGDSISSSIYIWGSSLRIAYVFPMIFALSQVFFGMIYVAKEILSRIGGNVGGKTVLAFLLFFFNGGFGIWYFINQGFGENFTRIFTEFYETPTNYVSENVQWHNILCDMLVPQRATLFGWAMLFPIFSLILKGKKYVGNDKKNTIKYFVFAGILSGGLVLIHTHSFLSLGVLCAGLLTMELFERIWEGRKNKSEKDSLVNVSGLIMILYLIVMTLFSQVQLADPKIDNNVFLSIGLVFILLFVSGLVWLFVLNIMRTPKPKRREWVSSMLSSWGVFLGCVLVLAIPQLVMFTFRQAQGDGFIRGGFNWVNNNSQVMNTYIGFYLKNIGIMFILAVMLFLFGTKKQKKIVFPACILWVICEFILFQPNAYDNNKLLLVAYLFFCIAIADFVWDSIPGWFTKLSAKAKKCVTAILVSVVLFLGTISGVLTLGREAVSDLMLYGGDYIHLAEWVENNTEPDAIFLTCDNHNNTVSSLTGRNIVCGSGSFLFFHGLDSSQVQQDVRAMYENPAQRDELLARRNVDYIVLGPYELNNYNITDREDMIAKYNKVYDEEGIVVLKVK